MTTYRQGDILLIATDAVPADAVPVTPTEGRHILATGETTGHAHAIEASATTAYLAAPNREMYPLVKEGEALLRHEEHGPIVLPPGAYVVRRQREWSAGEAGHWRQVAD